MKQSIKTSAGRLAMFKDMIYRSHISKLSSNQFEITNVVFDKEKNLLVFGLLFQNKKTALLAKNLINDATGENDKIEYTYINGQHILIFYYEKTRELKNERKVIENTTARLEYQTTVKITEKVKIQFNEIHENCVQFNERGVQEFTFKFMYASVIKQ